MRINEQIEQILSSMDNATLVESFLKLASEYATLACSCGFALEHDEFVINALKRCLEDDVDENTLQPNDGIIKISNNMKVRLCCHGDLFMPSLEDVMQIDMLVHQGVDSGTIVNCSDKEQVATWKKVD
jgi:UDP-2,3-diacylglucosamine pyrophosphatase LpxH